MTLRVVPPKPPTSGDQSPKDSAAECVPDDAVWLPFQQLDVYQVAREFVRLVHQAKITDAELRDQATRAAKRTFLGLCEGLPLEGQGLRRKYFNEANGSLHETLGAVDLAATIGAAREDDALAIQRLGVRLKHMVRALLH
jgi:hypothetical protein